MLIQSITFQHTAIMGVFEIVGKKKMAMIQNEQSKKKHIHLQ